MDLETNDEIVEMPSADDIRRVVLSLGGTENHFAILKRDEMTYLQTSNWKSLGFVLEYQEGSLQSHYQTISKPTAEQIQQAFIWYLHGDAHWKSAFAWVKSELGADRKAHSQREKASHGKSSEEELTMVKSLEIFGLKQGATRDQLKQQYREMIAKCHPDRVHHLDVEFQQLAEEKTKLLNKAYKILDQLVAAK